MRTVKMNNLILLIFIVFAFQLPKMSLAQKEPTVQGNEFKMPDYDDPGISKEDRNKRLAKANKNIITPKTKTVAPKVRSRGDVAGNCGGTYTFYGLCNIWQFTNSNFPVTKTTCGQAAACTAMWQAGLNKVYSTQHELAVSFYNFAPPKITIAGLVDAGSSLGSDWRQLNYGMDGYKNYGIKYSWLKGETELKKYLQMGLPCLIMLDTGTLSQYGFSWFTGHWVCAYGYNASFIYVSNFPNNRMTWYELRKAWGGVWNEGQLAKIHGTAEMFCVVWK